MNDTIRIGPGQSGTVEATFSLEVPQLPPATVGARFRDPSTCPHRWDLDRLAFDRRLTCQLGCGKVVDRDVLEVYR